MIDWGFGARWANVIILEMADLLGLLAAFSHV